MRLEGLVNALNSSKDDEKDTQTKSLLGSVLYKLQMDGYLDSKCEVSKLEFKWNNVFAAKDVNMVLDGASRNGPYSTLISRYSQHPEYIRTFLEGLQVMLKRYLITTMQLERTYWKKILRMPPWTIGGGRKAFLDKYNVPNMMEWAKRECHQHLLVIACHVVPSHAV